jgi:signal transduction histidine kinase
LLTRRYRLEGIQKAIFLCNDEGYFMHRHPWLALAGGFGGLLLIMAAAEVGGLLVINSLRSSDARVERRFQERSSLLEEIRSSIYLSGTIARDSLLAPVGGASSQMAEVKALEAKTNEGMDTYQKSVEPEEAAAFAKLRAEIAAYWQVLDRTFSWTDDERREYRYQFFYSELIPRRTAMLQIADRVGQLNELGLARGDQHLTGLFQRLYSGLVGMLVLTLIGGLALAIYTSVVVLRLQNEVRMKLEENVEAKTSLRDLSTKLVRVQEEERKALSRELHDEAGQAFSAILLETENLLDTQQCEASRVHLASIRSLAQRGLTEARDMALLLRPSMLDDLGLVAALNWQAKEMGKRTGVRVQVSAEEFPVDLPEEHKTCIYRVVQEALTNVVRHAQASGAQVRLQWSERGIELSVQDNGVGFDPMRVKGLGLLGMEERIRHLGGTFILDSQPGRGTLLTVALPLADLSAAPEHEINTDTVSRRS